VAFSQEQFLALEAAIAEGVTTVTWGGAGQTKTVTYRSLSELVRIYNMIGRSLGLIASTPRVTFSSFTKGFQYAGGGSGQGSFCGCCGGYHIASQGCGCHG
jgi:hypothetical protein